MASSKGVFCSILLFSYLIFAESACPQKCGCQCRGQCPPAVPIMLDNCGPNPCPLPPINAPPITTPLVNKPPVPLPSCVPPTKTVCNQCHCLKTVVKPQVVQQLITVPSIQRFIQTTHTPVVEHIQYQGIPINCPPYTPDPPPAAAAAVPPPPAPCAAGLAALLKALAAAKPPILPPCLRPAAPACAPPPPPPAPLCFRLGLLPPAAPPALPPCPPALPPCAPALPPCAPALPPCAPPCLPPPALPALSPCLLSLLSKLL